MTRNLEPINHDQGYLRCDITGCDSVAKYKDSGINLCERHKLWGNCVLAEMLRKEKVHKVVAVSGGYDPLHIGHLRNIKEASKLGDEVIVILTRDDQLIDKKGYVFMSYDERKEILEGLKGVAKVVQNIDTDKTCCESLCKYAPDIFAKGGDTWNENNLPEALICKHLGIEMKFGVGGLDKVQASSKLVEKQMKGKIRGLFCTWQ